jgi:hypothetical protein
VLTLYVVPVFYVLLDGLRAREAHTMDTDEHLAVQEVVEV